jgi:hypothetical protein
MIILQWFAKKEERVSCGLAHQHVGRFCERGDETLGYTKRQEFLDFHRHNFILNKKYCFMARQPYMGLSLSLLVSSRFHGHTQLDTPQSVGLLWTSDQPVAETST